jgi:hypothetical protein
MGCPWGGGSKSTPRLCPAQPIGLGSRLKASCGLNARVVALAYLMQAEVLNGAHLIWHARCCVTGLGECHACNGGLQCCRMDWHGTQWDGAMSLIGTQCPQGGRRSGCDGLANWTAARAMAAWRQMITQQPPWRLPSTQGDEWHHVTEMCHGSYSVFDTRGWFVTLHGSMVGISDRLKGGAPRPLIAPQGFIAAVAAGSGARLCRSCRQAHSFPAGACVAPPAFVAPAAAAADCPLTMVQGHKHSSGRVCSGGAYVLPSAAVV